jgi:hypothetical protein
MEQKAIVASGIMISHLIENEQASKTIFFIHGNSISSRSWTKQLKTPLLKDFRIPEKDYSLPGLARIMANATDHSTCCYFNMHWKF